MLAQYAPHEHPCSDRESKRSDAAEIRAVALQVSARKHCVPVGLAAYGLNDKAGEFTVNDTYPNVDHFMSWAYHAGLGLMESLALYDYIVTAWREDPADVDGHSYPELRLRLTAIVLEA